jgi:helicase
LLANRLANCRSELFQKPQSIWRQLVLKRGKRLLAALKAALTLLDWTESGDIEAVAAKHDFYPFDVQRLCDSMDRLLVAAGAITALAQPAEEIEQATEASEPNRSTSKINLLRQMIRNGLDQQAASLTLISGVGSKWARVFVKAGITNLSEFAATPLSRLKQFEGLSDKRASIWQDCAQKILVSQSARDSSPVAPSVRAKPDSFDLPVDPYRLRRALDLTVARQGERSWTVSGGLESHSVVLEQTRFCCDCADHAKGEVCKHLLAVRLADNDPELRAAVDRMVQTPQDHLDLFALWFDQHDL